MIIRSLLLLVAFCACSFAVENSLDTNGFVPPALVAISDASIEVGDAVWRSADGKVYVVQAKITGAATATLVDAASPGFVATATVGQVERVIEIAHLTIDIPGTPAAVASGP